MTSVRFSKFTTWTSSPSAWVSTAISQMRQPSTSLINAQTTSYSLPGTPAAPGSIQLLETSMTLGSLGSICWALPISNDAFGDPIGEISSPLERISWRARVERSDSMTFALLVRIPSKNAPTTSSGLIGLDKFSRLRGIISSWGVGSGAAPLFVASTPLDAGGERGAGLAVLEPVPALASCASLSLFPELQPTCPSIAARVAAHRKRFMSW